MFKILHRKNIEKIIKNQYYFTIMYINKQLMKLH